MSNLNKLVDLIAQVRSEIAVVTAQVTKAEEDSGCLVFYILSQMHKKTESLNKLCVDAEGELEELKIVLESVTVEKVEKAEKVDLKELASQVDLRLLAEHLQDLFDYEALARELDLSQLAGEFSTRDIAEELDLDSLSERINLSRLANDVDLGLLAKNIVSDPSSREAMGEALMGIISRKLSSNH